MVLNSARPKVATSGSDPKRTSPYKFYQFWLNASDTDAETYIKIFSLKDRTTLESLISNMQQNRTCANCKRHLAEEVTARVHSEEDLEKAIAASDILFGKSTSESLRKLDNDTFLDVFEGVPQFHIARSVLESGADLPSLLCEHSNVLPSKGELRRPCRKNPCSSTKRRSKMRI